MTTQVDTPSSRLPAPATAGNWKHRLKLPSGRIEGIVGAGVLVWLVAVPFLVNGFGTSILTQMLAFAMLASSLHILMGWTGIVSLGQAAYFGVAGYAVGLTALHLTTNVLVLLTVGMVAGGVAAASTGWLIVRRGGPYLLMLTLAFGELLSAAANSWASLTGGYNGLAAVPAFTLGSYSFDGPAENYWLVLVVFVSVYVLLAVLARSPFVKTLNGIRDNESKMRALGYSTRLFKYAVFCLSGAVAGMAGMAWVSQTRFISPADLNMHASSLVLLAVAVGGMRRQWGPCIGAVLIVAAQQLLPASIEGKGPLMLGVLLIVVVYLLPGGAASVPGRVATFFGRTR